VEGDVVLWIVVATALAFDFTNGFHDTANAVATSISTRAMAPRVAVGLAAALNFVGAFLSLEVATTVASELIDPRAITLAAVLAGVIAAVAWTVVTWWSGLPSSSSHALIGGLVGAAFAAAGSDAVLGDGVMGKVLVPAVLAPALALVIGAIVIVITYRMVGHQRPGVVSRGFRFGQVASGGLLALAHGANDGQKTMGVIVLALVANGNLSARGFEVPFWVVAAAAAAIALGTYSGGWRIVRTVGARIQKLDPAQGFTAQGAGAAVILAASHYGLPLSTTQTIAGGVVGSGAGKRFSAVRWGVAGNVAAAWLVTLPAAAAIGAAIYGFTRIFGEGAAGPVVVTVVAVVMATVAFLRRARAGAPVAV
jgi:PiT family inorganic phosphate transporter